MNVGTIDRAAAPLVGASLGQAMARFARHALRVRGRASRSEYWWWMVINVVVLGICQFLMPAVLSGRTPNPTLLLGPFGSMFFASIPILTVPETDAPSSPFAVFFLIVAGIWMLVTLIPGITVFVRRLHDSNMSGLWSLLAVLPFGSFLLLAFALRRPRSDGARFD